MFSSVLLLLSSDCHPLVLPIVCSCTQAVAQVGSEFTQTATAAGRDRKKYLQSPHVGKTHFPLCPSVESEEK